LSRSSAPPLRIALRTDPLLPSLAVLALCALTAGVVAYALAYSGWAHALLALVLSLLAAAWSLRLRDRQWDWLGCDAEGQWWLATREGLRQEQRIPIRVSGDSRVGARMVVLVCAVGDPGRIQVLWLPWWRLDPEDFRRLRVRLRWPPEAEGKPGLMARLRAGAYRAVAILSAMTKRGAQPMEMRRDMAAVDHLLNDDPEHVYSEDELDAIEDIDPELALRLDRAQTFARRQASDEPAEGPIDEAAVRQAVEEARRILMQDGGDIEYVGLNGRTVQVRLKGACVGCPRSTLDLKNVVERLVRARAPGVERVANTF
jgi:toxin CptA